MIGDVFVSILTSSKIGDKESGRAILHALEPAYEPEKYNTFEPIRLPYSRAKIDEALEKWGSGGFLWRKKPRILGHAMMSGKVHDCIYIHMPLKAFNESEAMTLFRRVGDRFGIDIAYIHASATADMEDLDYYVAHICDFTEGLTTHELRECLPGLCWATLFGEPYQQLFGDRLSDVPAYSVKEIGGATCIQLTEDIRDVDKKREEYEAAKKAAIDHLDSDAFRVMGVRRKYRVPEFNL